MDELEWLRERVAGMTEKRWWWDSYQSAWIGKGEESTKVFECKQPHPQDNVDALGIATLRNVAAELLEVAKASWRVGEIECGEPIPENRLDAVAHANIKLRQAIRREMERKR